jgi:hypothetical protein
MNKISKYQFRNKTVFGLFTVTVTISVAVFLVCTRFQNGFLCDFIALLYKVVFIDFCLEYKHNNGMTFSPDLELKNSFCLAIIFSGNGGEIWYNEM